MEIIMCILIFAMGTIFGSFFTLAVYRIPLKKDITHERSFCPNCNHKLNFFDLIPIFSYIFLRGKCRYCGQKIRIRYLILEVLSGFVFLIAYLSMNFEYPFFEKEKMVYFVAFVFFYITIVLVSGIDKEYRTINKAIVVFGTIMQGFFVAYQYITKGILFQKYSIYSGLIILIMLFSRTINKKLNKKNYAIELLYFIVYINIFIDSSLFFLIILLSLLFSMWKKVIISVNKNANLQAIDALESKSQKLSIGFYIGISTIIVVLIQNFTYYWG